MLKNQSRAITVVLSDSADVVLCLNIPAEGMPVFVLDAAQAREVIADSKVQSVLCYAVAWPSITPEMHQERKAALRSLAEELFPSASIELLDEPDALAKRLASQNPRQVVCWTIVDQSESNDTVFFCGVWEKAMALLT